MKILLIALALALSGCAGYAHDGGTYQGGGGGGNGGGGYFDQGGHRGSGFCLPGQANGDC